MQSLLQQVLSNLDAEQQLTHLIQRLDMASQEEIESVIVQLNCLTLSCKEVRDMMITRCTCEVFYHKNRHMLNSILGNHLLTKQKALMDLLLDYEDSMDRQYINSAPEGFSHQEASNQKYKRLHLKQRHQQFIQSVVTLSEQVNIQKNMGLECEEFFKKSIKTINQFLSDPVCPLVTLGNKLVPITDVGYDSYYIKTKNRTPLVLNLGFGRFMFKDDTLLANEMIANDIINFLSSNIDCVTIKKYEIIPFYKGALYEFVQGALTVSQIKKRHDNSINTYLESMRTQATSKRFCQSYAGFCIVQYVLMLTDRHNQNIMITQEGDIFHIDLAYIFEMRVGRMKFESAPFKFVEEYKHLMGDFSYWESLLVKGFSRLIKILPELLARIKAMMRVKQLECFKGFSLEKYRNRFPSSQESVLSFTQKLIYESHNAFSTRQYDRYQYTTNGILF